MLKLYINNSDQSDYLADNSLSITDQIQNKSNTCRFNLNEGATAPSENYDIQIFDCVEIVSLVGTTLEVIDTLRSGQSILDFNKYRINEYIWLDVGGSDQEKVKISAISNSATEGQVTITLTDSALYAHSSGQLAGKKIFGGTLSSVSKKNPHLLTDVEYSCGATDYTKIFDKKLINDSWTDSDARYIINDALNTTINYNHEVDDMDYANTTALRAEWIKSGDGGNPTLETADFIQGASCALFDWTNAGGTATFTADPTSADYSDFTKVPTGLPTQGNLTFWYKRTSDVGISTISVEIGSGVGDYLTLSFTPIESVEWQFISLPLSKGSVTGTPDWTVLDYIAIIIAETSTSSILIDDIRITAGGSFTMYNFEETLPFDSVHAGFKKPTMFIDSLSDVVGYYWYIDYDKDIHFFDRETNTSPFDISDTSDNFFNLEVSIDTSQLKNRQTVRGGTKTSDSLYSQVVEGDDVVREWITKSHFENLSVYLDDGSSTDTTEAGTTTTNVVATGHGLVDGDYIVNRTRSNAVRQISYVDPDTFTVDAVTGQTNGDTFSKFDTAKTVGIENLDDETLYDYMMNFTEKSIRASSVTDTLAAGEFLLFTYNEIIPIRVQVSDHASIFNLKGLIGGDGIFDGAVITDESLDSTQSARDRAQAEVDQYSNALVEITFVTDEEGLSSGQIIHITDTNKGVDDDYVIQRVRSKYTGDFASFDISCASTLFGIIEYFQKLSTLISARLIDEDEVIDQIVGEDVEITVSEVNTFVPSESATGDDTITITPSESATDRDMTTDPYLWQPDASDARWNLAQWG